jgi:hypothetical protein
MIGGRSTWTPTCAASTLRIWVPYTSFGMGCKWVTWGNDPTPTTLEPAGSSLGWLIPIPLSRICGQSLFEWGLLCHSSTWIGGYANVIPLPQSHLGWLRICSLVFGSLRSCSCRKPGKWGWNLPWETITSSGSAWSVAVPTTVTICHCFVEGHKPRLLSRLHYPLFVEW